MTFLRRAGAALSIIGALGACQEGPPSTATSFELEAPEVTEVLYPAREGSLLRHAGLSRLPADDTSWVVVADLPALLSVAPLGDLLSADAEPYDKLIESASVHAAGMVLGREIEHLRTAGLDLTAPWGMARVGVARILFGKVTDPQALIARVKKRAAKEDLDVDESELGGGTVLSIERSRALWIVDGLAYLCQLQYGRAKETAERLAATPKDKSLASQPHFVQARDRVQFGDHAAAYVNLTPELKALSLKHDVTYLENRYSELEEWLTTQKASSDPPDAETKAKIAEIEARLRHRDAEVARVKARQERVEGLPETLGIAIGLEIHAATLRGKAHLPLPKPLATDLLGDATLPPSSTDASVEPVPTLSHWELPLSPTAALEIATRTLGTTRSRALYRWIGGDTPLESDPILPLLSGAVSRSHHDVDGKGRFRLELGLAPDAATTLRGWLDRIDDEAADVPVERDGDRLHLAELDSQELWIQVGDRSVVFAGHEQLLDARPRHAESDDPDLVQALSLLSPTEGWLSLPAASFIPSSESGFGSSFGALSRPMPMSMFGVLGSMGSASSKGDADEERKKIEKKRKRLEKRRAKVRGDLATLRSRHRIEARSGRSRLLTALGTSVARVQPDDEGVTFYFAQRIAETDMAALSEHAVYALVDSSSESDTAKQIRKLEEKLEELDEQLMDLPSVAFVSAIGSAGFLSGDMDRTLMDVMATSPREGAFGAIGLGEKGSYAVPGGGGSGRATAGGGMVTAGGAGKGTP